MHSRVLILGAGFGGLETAARLSELLGDEADVTLIDAGTGFTFGYHKIDLLFSQTTLDDVRTPYHRHELPGVTFVNELITDIDPVARRVETPTDTYSGDVMVVALGADYNLNATPGLTDLGFDVYSVSGTLVAAEALSHFSGGDIVIGVCGSTFKCPPAPHETALRLHDYLESRGIREKSSITVVVPLPVPLPPAPALTEAIMQRYEDRGIAFIGGHLVRSLTQDDGRKVAVLDDGRRLPADLFLGVPVHVAPEVVAHSGMLDGEWIAVSRDTAATRFPGVFAVGDVTSIGTAKAGVFAEGAGRVVADQLVARLRGQDPTPNYNGRAWCLVELGHEEVAGVDIDFFGGSHPHGEYAPPTELSDGAKDDFALVRTSRWF